MNGRLIFLAGPILVVLCFFPGFLTNDSVEQLLQARSGSLTDAHPPLMAIIWRVCDAIVAGPFLMLVLQVVLFWLGTWLVFGSRQPQYVYLCLFFPPVFSILGIVWKDLQMAGWLAFGVGMLVRSFPARAGMSWGKVSLAILAFSIAAGMRHNAVAAVIPFLALLGIEFFILLRASGRSVPRSAATSISLFAVTLGVLLALPSRINATFDVKPSNFWQSVAIYDIAGVLANSSSSLLTPSDYDRLEEGLAALSTLRGEERNAEILRHYNPGYWAPLVRAPGPLRMTQDAAALFALKRLWLYMITTYPRAYAKHKLEFTRRLIGLTPNIWAPVWSPDFFPEVSRRQLGIDFRLSSAQALIFDFIEDFSKTFLFRVWTWLVLSIGVAGVGVFLLFLRCRENACWSGNWREFGTGSFVKGPGLVITLCASAWTYEASLIAGAGSFDFRYSHWPIYAVWVATLLLIPDVFALLRRTVRRREFESP